MRIIGLICEFTARLALLFFSMFVGVIFFTFVVSLFIPIFSLHIKLIAVTVAALSVFSAIYLFFYRFDKDEKIWSFIPNLLMKGE